MIVPLLLVIACLSSSVAPAQGFTCEIETAKCASQRKDDIQGKMKQFLFRSGCRDYKVGLDCLYELQKTDSECTVTNYPGTFQDAKSDLYDATQGLCGVDGSIDGCGYGFGSCITHVGKIRDKNNNSTCSEYIKMSDCVELTRDQHICPKWVEDFLYQTLETMKIELQTECFRTCDQSLKLCAEDVPLNLTLDNRITEEKQEVLCAELEAALSCMNATDVQDLCEKEHVTPYWQAALDVQTSHYQEFCSIPAKTCLAEIQGCSIDLDATAAAGVSSPEGIIELCQELEKTIDCVDKTSQSEYCQGKTGAKLLATTLNDHKDDLDTYCGVSQCKYAFPSCYDLITEVRLKVSDAPQTLTCQEVTLSLACARSMKEFEPCHTLQFGNITFENAVMVLNDLKCALCFHKEEEEVTECERVFPECFASIIHAKEKPNSCSAIEYRNKCTKKLTVSMSCRDSKHAQKVADIRRADAKYYREHCKGSEPDAESQTEPGTAAMLHTSTALLLTSLLTALAISH